MLSSRRQSRVEANVKPWLFTAKPSFFAPTADAVIKLFFLAHRLVLPFDVYISPTISYFIFLLLFAPGIVREAIFYWSKLLFNLPKNRHTPTFSNHSTLIMNFQIGKSEFSYSNLIALDDAARPYEFQ
jgi:hypothetical protein